MLFIHTCDAELCPSCVHEDGPVTELAVHPFDCVPVKHVFGHCEDRADDPGGAGRTLPNDLDQHVPQDIRPQPLADTQLLEDLNHRRLNARPQPALGASLDGRPHLHVRDIARVELSIATTQLKMSNKDA